MTLTRAPRRIGNRYRLDRQIAVGGTAHVWLARDERLHRPVAVKLLHPHLLPDEVSRQRLAAEARAAAGLQHPGIAAVYDVHATARNPAIVMEMVDGESLAARLKRDGPMAPRAAATLAAQVADSLYHAHRHGIVHRDVKPGNVLVERTTGRARLIDFGIAHSLADGTGSLTDTGTTIGTPRYMAPEQLVGDAVGPRTDLWGLGCLLYETLTGRPPFDGPTAVAIARQQAAGPPRLDGVDPGLAQIVRECLAPRVEDRPIHARAVAMALRRWLTEQTAVTQAAPVVEVPPGVRRAPEAAFVRRHRLPLAAAALAAMLLVGAVAGTVLRPDSADGGLLGGAGGTVESVIPISGVVASPTPTPAPTAAPPHAGGAHDRDKGGGGGKGKKH
ncbi:MAG TPA: serine/threonine-protein kinase [Candidatus Limnocylindria bacterium]